MVGVQVFTVKFSQLSCRLKFFIVKCWKSFKKPKTYLEEKKGQANREWVIRELLLLFCESCFIDRRKCFCKNRLFHSQSNGILQDIYIKWLSNPSRIDRKCPGSCSLRRFPCLNLPWPIDGWWPISHWGRESQVQQTFASKNTKTEKSIEMKGSINGHFKGSCYSKIAKRIFDYLRIKTQGGKIPLYHGSRNISALLTILFPIQCLAQSKALLNIWWTNKWSKT